MTKTKSDPITHQMPPRHAATWNHARIAAAAQNQIYPAGGGPVPPLNPSGPNGSRRRGRNASNRHFAARLVGQAVGRRLDELADMQSQIKLAKGRGR